MKTFFELRENVKTADKKPEVYTKPDGKKGVRMVPVDREVVKQEKNLEWLKAALEAQARKTKPCDEDVEETAEAKVDELNKSTLANYVKKASDDRTQNAYDVGKSGKMNYKGLKRRQGINRAVNKLVKENDDDEEDKRPHTHALVDKKGRAHGFAPYKMYDGHHHIITNRVGMRVATSDDHADAKRMAKNRGGSVITTKSVKLKKPIHPKDAEKLYGKSIKGHYHEAKEVDEVLDRPGALDSYRKKADASGNKARNSATRKIVRGNPDVSKEKDTMRKRNKGQDMADRAANRHFRKSIGLGYNSKKESVELEENKFANKSAERHKEVMKQARADMKSANNRDAMVKAMNRYQSAKKAHDRATRASFDEAKVDEISNAKMGQYVRKATDDAARRAMDAGEKAGRGDSKGFGKQMVKSRQRVKGVQKAMDKMDKNRLYGRQ